MKFLRKPLAILSGVLLLAGLVLTVILALTAHGGTYAVTAKEGDVETRMEITFKDNKVYFKTLMNGEVLYEDKEGQDYVIKNGKLYAGINEEDYNKAVEEANKLEGDEKQAALDAIEELAEYKVNAFKLTPNMEAKDEATEKLVKEGTLVCSVNNALLYVGIALMAVGVVGAVVACVFINLDKKGTKKTEANA